jgi:hypothetical protein
MARGPRYYKRPYNGNLRGRGASVWFLEVGEDQFPIRQLEIYENGSAFAYDESHLYDSSGMLTDERVEPLDFAAFEITQAEFERVWSSTEFDNRVSLPSPSRQAR